MQLLLINKTVGLNRWVCAAHCWWFGTLTSINNFTGESAKQRTCVGYSGVQPLLFVIEREGLDFSQCKKREFWLKPTLVRCFALLPVKLFMEVSVPWLRRGKELDGTNSKMDTTGRLLSNS
jgi:hypothetical protein